jgi:hypothetical protein
MIEPHGFDHHVLQRHSALLQVVEATLRFHLAHVHGKVRRRHLFFHHSLERAKAAGGVKGETVFRIVVERSEEGNALNVVPVKVRNEDVGPDRLVRGVALELLPERTQSGATVEDVEVIAEANFDAGGVASIAQVVGLGSRRGPAYTPELNTHTVPWKELS